jgi:CheY-like chemotaxis protein
MHILVVDDHPGLADSLAGLLEDHCPAGTSTAVAMNGHDALTAAARRRPDVVIFDIDMPVMNGMDAAVALRQLAGDPQPLLIAMSGHPDHVLASTCTGVFAMVLNKPIDVDRLLSVVLPMSKCC